MIRDAVRLSGHVIEKDPHQFASQVVGRLLPYQDRGPIGGFIREISAAAPKPWLRPLHPALHPPGTPLLRTLQDHSSIVNCAAVTPDAKCAVSASFDHTLKVWDLETGRVLRTLEGQWEWVDGVAVTPDGKRVVSASRLRVWDLETGRVLHAVEGTSGGGIL